MSMIFFETALRLEFSPFKDELYFLEEYNHLDNNAALARLKKAGDKIDFTEGERFLFEVLLSLKDDLYKLENKLFNQKELIHLNHNSTVCGVNFEHFELVQDILEEEQVYYARIELKHQLVSFFFKALKPNLALITKIKNEDRLFFDQFVMHTQRQNINNKKGQQ